MGGERFGRYSFIGLPAHTLLRASGFRTEVVTAGQVTETFEGNPLDFIASYQQRFRVALRPGCRASAAGWLATSATTPCATSSPSSARHGRAAASIRPTSCCCNAKSWPSSTTCRGGCTSSSTPTRPRPEAYFKGQRRLSELTDKLKYSVTAPPVRRGTSYAVEREFDKADYLNAVAQSKELIAAGDMMQVQIGQRLKKRYTESPLSLYRALRSLNPSPYMYFYDMGDFQIVGASPEILVRQEHTPEGDKITIRPLAGTRPRGATPEQDKALEAELSGDPKERAEHLMLIDLARNDIGRIAKTGSVKVTDAFVIERYSHVMHLVSNVEGMLLDGMTNLDVLKATFPAGTLTGAPKIRAMEIIDELEPSSAASTAAPAATSASPATWTWPSRSAPAS